VSARTLSAAPGSKGAGTRWLATALLVAMAGLFLLARHMGGANPAWIWPRAFAEAAMVGGLADWFAVTALFRRPLGLPIPHTAIIPTNKDRIAENMAGFLRANFLTAPVVARRMGRHMTLAPSCIRWRPFKPWYIIRSNGRANFTVLV